MVRPLVGGQISGQGSYWPALTLVRIKVRHASVSHEPSSHQSFPACESVRLAWCDLGVSLPSLSCEYICLILAQVTHSQSILKIESER